MYINDTMYVDHWDDRCDDVSFSMNKTENYFYDTVIEYKEHQEAAHFKLELFSLFVFREVVPPTCACTLSLHVTINGAHVQSSPITDKIKVKPVELYAPACIVDGLPLVMKAGEYYTVPI